MQAQKNGKNLKFSLRSIVAKFFAALFSRLVLTAVAILIQFFYLFFLAYQFTEYAGYIETGARIIGLMVAFYIVYMDQNPAYKIAWLVLIAVLPEMGTILFLLYGNRRPQRVIARRTGPVKAAHREDLQQVSDLPFPGGKFSSLPAHSRILRVQGDQLLSISVRDVFGLLQRLNLLSLK